MFQMKEPSGSLGDGTDGGGRKAVGVLSWQENVYGFGARHLIARILNNQLLY